MSPTCPGRSPWSRPACSSANVLQRLTPGGDIRPALVAFWSLLDQLLNTMLFLLIGFQVLGLTFQISHLLQVVLAVPLAILARMVSVALPLAFTRGSPRAKSREAAVLTWAGLRGGISVALALTLPASPWRDDLLVVCYAVVVFTIVVQGLSMPAVPAQGLWCDPSRARTCREPADVAQAWGSTIFAALDHCGRRSVGALDHAVTPRAPRPFLPSPEANMNRCPLRTVEHAVISSHGQSRSACPASAPDPTSRVGFRRRCWRAQSW